jgi:NAD(P)-dependent dehydrogenase (short-subunit alcohol dehydrogenase family)
VKRVLVIGGYGGFGARVSERLARAGHEVLVAGRDGAKAAAFCGSRPGLLPIELKREEDLASALARYRRRLRYTAPPSLAMPLRDVRAPPNNAVDGGRSFRRAGG